MTATPMTDSQPRRATFGFSGSITQTIGAVAGTFNYPLATDRRGMSVRSKGRDVRLSTSDSGSGAEGFGFDLVDSSRHFST